MVDEVSFTHRERALEPLAPGTRVLCFLRLVGGKKMIAQGLWRVQCQGSTHHHAY
jgi:hypothetical protein